MKINNLLIIVLAFALIQFSCSSDDAEKSVITTTKSFTFEGLQDSYTIKEGESIVLNYTFSDDQIFDMTVEHSGSGSAVEGKDYFIGPHELELVTLEKSGSVEVEAVNDLFRENNEYIDLLLSSKRGDNAVVSKIVRINIENVGGCPEFVKSEFVGDYTVEADGWQDYAVGTTISVEDAGDDKLSFKYNCGAEALPIVLTIHPDDFSISGDNAQYCSYSLPPLTKFLGDIVEASSQVNTCDKVLNVSIKHSDENGGNYGTYEISLKKK